MHQFSVNRRLCNPLYWKILYTVLDLISQFEKQLHEIRCLHAKISQISNGNTKQRRAHPLGDRTYLGLDFLWCFCIILPMASGKWNSSFLSWEQRLAELKKMLIYLKHFCPLFFLLLQEFWREKKVSCCIILLSMLMKFAFKTTAWKFYEGEWFLNKRLPVPMDDV